MYIYSTKPSKQVKKYLVYFDADDRESGRRYTVIKETVEVPVESGIKTRYTNFANHLNDTSDDAFVLPPTHPIRSAAGAILDPNYATPLIEAFIGAQGSIQAMTIEITAVVETLLEKNVPFADISKLTTNPKIDVQFPDGSIQEYEVQFSPKIKPDGSVEMEIELVPTGQATDQMGVPIPTRPVNFNNFSANNAFGSLSDWIDWAQHNGVPVYGLPAGSKPSCQGDRMVCVVDGEDLYCSFVKGNCE